MDDKDVLTLMNQSLPKYAVNCFLRAGYDNSSAITQMVTDEGPGKYLRPDRRIYLEVLLYGYVMLPIYYCRK